MSAYRIQGTVDWSSGGALNGVQVFLCTQPASFASIPPSPLATTYTDATGLILATQPALTDGLGNWFTYAASGTYTVVLYDPLNRIPITVFPDQLVVSPGSGTVTNIALTMPAEFSVAGSPISASGTLVVTKANQNANLFFAGPSSGSPAAPTFRAIAAADLTGLAGTVTSVTLAVAAGSLFTCSVSGTNPITTSGTFTLNINFATQNANTFLAGPASGGAGNISARNIVPADLPGLVATAFSAAPSFDASTGNSFKITLTGNVTSSTIVNPTAGQRITLIIAQDGTGGHTFAWPSNVRGWSNVEGTANAVSVQDFIYDGAQWRATGPGSVNFS